MMFIVDKLLESISRIPFQQNYLQIIWWSPPGWNDDKYDDDKPWWKHVPTHQPTSLVSSPRSNHHNHHYHYPTYFPSKRPSSKPSSKPTHKPIAVPSHHPSHYPSRYPSKHPIPYPSQQPVSQPTSYPSTRPSYKPIAFPSHYPSQFPSISPTTYPSPKPTSRPSTSPSTRPFKPTSYPSTSLPTPVPSYQDSLHPTIRPSSRFPTTEPTILLTSLPTYFPSSHIPTYLPSYHNTKQPTIEPTTKPPTIEPTIALAPSSHPSVLEYPTYYPSSSNPTSLPTYHYTLTPTNEPSTVSPSNEPTINLELLTPSFQPSMLFSPNPTPMPSGHATFSPTIDLSTIYPTTELSIHLTTSPSFYPSLSHPTLFPTYHDTRSPTIELSMYPTLSLETLTPTYQPSAVEYSAPTMYPSSYYPTYLPAYHDTTSPTIEPSISDNVLVPSSQPVVLDYLSPSEESSAITPSTISSPIPSPADMMFDYSSSAPTIASDAVYDNSYDHDVTSLMPTSPIISSIPPPSPSSTPYRHHQHTIFFRGQMSHDTTVLLSGAVYGMLILALFLVCMISFYSCCCANGPRKHKDTDHRGSYIAIPTASKVPIASMTAESLASYDIDMDDLEIEMTAAILNTRPRQAREIREQKKQELIHDIYMERFMNKRPRDAERYTYEKKCRELAARLLHHARLGLIDLDKKQLASANCIHHFYDSVENQDADYPTWSNEPFAEACEVLNSYDRYLRQQQSVHIQQDGRARTGYQTF